MKKNILTAAKKLTQLRLKNMSPNWQRKKFKQEILRKNSWSAILVRKSL